MKAMILAAGLGTRLGELTQKTPKCLVTAGGQTLLEHVVDRLKAAGVTEVMINLYHLADQVEAFVRAHQGFGLSVSFSREEVLLGTGGGLFRCADFFDAPFLVHNADIYTELDLHRMVDAHQRDGALATLAVIDRVTKRYFLFDQQNRLSGWRNLADGKEQIVVPGPQTQLAFSGIQVLSPGILRYMQDQGAVFGLMGPYLKAAAAGERLMAYRMDDAYWMDAGTPERLESLDARLKMRPSGIGAGPRVPER